MRDIIGGVPPEKIYYEEDWGVVINGDVLEILRCLPDGCVDMVITSPPYWGLRHYGVDGQIGLEDSLEEYLDKMIEVMKELKRVVKDEGSIWVNIGDCYGGNSKGANQPKFINKNPYDYIPSDKGNKIKKDKCLLMVPERFAIRCIDELGLILRNKIIYAKQVLIKKENKTIGSVMPTSTKDRFNESYEFLYFFVKNKKYYSNLDAVRIPYQYEFIYDFRPRELKIGATRGTGEGYPESKYNKFDFRGNGKSNRKQDNVPSRNANIYKGFNDRWREKIYQGKYARAENPEAFGSPMARLMRKGDKIIIGEAGEMIHHGQSKKAEELGLTSFELSKLNPHPLGKTPPSIWQINPEPHNFQKELGVDTEHFASFPRALCHIPIKFACPEGGIVLDPFCGSGTALLVAKELGRKFIGIDLNAGYCEIAKRRLLKENRLL